MRTNKELLELVFHYINNPTKNVFFYSGLCSLIIKMKHANVINSVEYETLYTIFENGRKLLNIIEYDYDNDGYWWKAGEVQPRIDFINKLIEKYSNE